MTAFERSFAAGFGAEVDVRDRDGTLVVSHDPPGADALLLVDLLEAHGRLGSHLPLALNVKADGLAGGLSRALEAFAVASYFVFDMAVPDALDYARRGMRAFTRESEHEPAAAFYPLAAGVWLDCFERDWIDADHIGRHLAAGKDVALVSPELHRRPYATAWERWAGIEVPAGRALYLCTDHPEAARERFTGVEATA